MSDRWLTFYEAAAIAAGRSIEPGSTVCDEPVTLTARTVLRRAAEGRSLQAEFARTAFDPQSVGTPLLLDALSQGKLVAVARNGWGRVATERWAGLDINDCPPLVLPEQGRPADGYGDARPIYADVLIDRVAALRLLKPRAKVTGAPESEWADDFRLIYGEALLALGTGAGWTSDKVFASRLVELKPGREPNLNSVKNFRQRLDLASGRKQADKLR